MLHNNGVYPNNVYCLRLPATTEKVRATPKAYLLKVRVMVFQDSVTQPAEEREVEVWFPERCVHVHLHSGAFAIERSWMQKKEEEIAATLKAKLVGIVNDGLETIRVQGAGRYSVSRNLRR